MQWLKSSGRVGFSGPAACDCALSAAQESEARACAKPMLWRKTEERSEANKPIEKLKNQLLLWLQLLLVVLLSLALMRPASIGGSQGETALIFDLSASMRTETAAYRALMRRKRTPTACLTGSETTTP